MVNRWKRNAGSGMSGWAVLAAAMVLLATGRSRQQSWAQNLTGQTILWLILTILVLQFACFYWAWRNLAKVKEVSEGIAWIGLLGPIAQLGLWFILLALPDKASARAAWERRGPRGSPDMISKSERVRIAPRL